MRWSVYSGNKTDEVVVMKCNIEILRSLNEARKDEIHENDSVQAHVNCTKGILNLKKNNLSEAYSHPCQVLISNGDAFIIKKVFLIQKKPLESE